MGGKEVRQKLLEIFGNIKFNKNFDNIAAKLKDNMLSDLLDWCQRCKDEQELGSVPGKKEYKNLYVFFRKIASNIRVTLIKEQNSDFIEITLDDHKVYDNLRLKLGYKKSSYYGS
ncbi:MAG: hypothetical protein U9O94_05690 [Nanoarchaeota archaeon]|nr:hypothetical protein [Nanoarchaeota archaeon]